MRIYDLNTRTEGDDVYLSVKVDSTKLGTRELWFSTPKEYSDYLCTDQYDGFLVGLLYPAMQYGENITIEGTVSKKLLFNINNYVIPLLMSFSDNTKNIAVKAFQVSSSNQGGKGVGTGFSGGVDSFSTVYNRYSKEDDPAFKVNSFLFLNVGSHGLEQSSSELKFKERFEFLKEFPQEIGLEFVPLNSNLHQFHPWGHQLTATITALSGVLILQKHYSRYYYSSGLSFSETLDYGGKYYRDYDVGLYCDPMLVPLLSTESIELVLDGAEYKRSDKVLNITSYEPTYRYLNVCVSEELTHKNCSKCSKCLRTLIALDSSGDILKYSDVFNLNIYAKEKTYYLHRQVIQSALENPFARDNLSFINNHGQKTPRNIESYYYLASKNPKYLATYFLSSKLPRVYSRLRDINKKLKK